MSATLKNLSLKSIIDNKVDVKEYISFLKIIGISLPSCEYCDSIVYFPKDLFWYRFGSFRKEITINICDGCLKTKRFCYACKTYKPNDDIYKTVVEFGTRIQDQDRSSFNMCSSCIKNRPCNFCNKTSLETSLPVTKDYNGEIDDNIRAVLVQYQKFGEIIDVCNCCDQTKKLEDCDYEDDRIF